MKELLKLSRWPTAVFVFNDLLALEAIQAIKEKGLSIPTDMAVVGFDDISFAAIPEIQLTTVAQLKYVMGELALKILIKQIQGSYKKDINQKILLDSELIVKKTG